MSVLRKPRATADRLIFTFAGSVGAFEARVSKNARTAPCQVSIDLVRR